MNDTHKASARGRPTKVVESFPVPGSRPDYADAFEILRSPSDKRNPERWARSGFDKLSPKSRRSGMLAHRYLLGFRLGPWESSGHIFGWHIAESTPELLHLEAKGNIMEGHMIWRLEDERLVMTTFLKFNIPVLAAGIWAFAGRIHRGAAPGLLSLAASGAD